MLLKALVRSDRAMGLSNIAIEVNEARDTIENILEPHLIRYGLIQRTARGRVITDMGIQFLEDM